MTIYPSTALDRLEPTMDDDDKQTQADNIDRLKDWRRQTAPVSFDWYDLGTASLIGTGAGLYPASSVVTAQRFDATVIPGYKPGHRFMVLMVRAIFTVAWAPGDPLAQLFHCVTVGSTTYALFIGPEYVQGGSVIVVVPLSANGDCYLHWYEDWSAHEAYNIAKVGGFF